MLLNEARHLFFRRTIQTMIYLPHFLSWIVLGGILLDILSVQRHSQSGAQDKLGFESQLFLGQQRMVPRHHVITSGFWKNVGFSTIVYLAALTAINPVPCMKPPPSTAPAVSAASGISPCRA